MTTRPLSKLDMSQSPTGHRGSSLWSDAWRNLLRGTNARIGLAIIGFLVHRQG